MNSTGGNVPAIAAALCVDTDNLQRAAEETDLLGIADGAVPWGLLMDVLRSAHGLDIGIRRAYGDTSFWARSVFKKKVYKGNEIRSLLERDFREQKTLLELGFELTMTPPYGGGGKNRADILLAIQIGDLARLHSHVTHFCIASGDSDFSPVVRQLKAMGKQVSVLTYRRNSSPLLEAVADRVIYIDNAMVAATLTDPLRGIIRDWMADSAMLKRLQGGVSSKVIQEALKGRKPGIRPGWFGHRRWSDVLEVLEGMEWAHPTIEEGSARMTVRGDSWKLELTEPEVTRPTATTGQPVGTMTLASGPSREQQLAAALKRRNVGSEPELRGRVVTWLHGRLDGFDEEVLLKDLVKECAADLSDDKQRISNNRVAHAVTALFRCGAFVRSDGSQVEAFSVPGRFCLTSDCDAVRKKLVQYYVDALRGETRLTAEAPLDRDDASALTKVIFGRWNTQLEAMVSAAMLNDDGEDSVHIAA